MAIARAKSVMTRLQAINVTPRGPASLLEQYKLNVAGCRSIGQAFAFCTTSHEKPPIPHLRCAIKDFQEELVSKIAFQ